jgi:hypothetical protein
MEIGEALALCQDCKSIRRASLVSSSLLFTSPPPPPDPSSPSSQPSSTPAPFARLNVLHTKDGRSFPYHECVWCTEGQAAPWLMKTGEGSRTEGGMGVREVTLSETALQF